LAKNPPRLAIISDYLEENWTSMDLCVQMLIQHIRSDQSEFIHPVEICPKFNWRFSNIPWVKQKRFAYNADRLMNRFWDYPQYLKQKIQQENFDFYHIADHSYAQLAHVLPPERTGVFCHDIDAFRSLLEPNKEVRPNWYQAMSRRILRGMQQCAVVFYTTTDVRKQIEHYQLVEPSRLVQAPLGIAAEFNLTPESNMSSQQDLLERVGNLPFILHVGSCIPRKRIDILLNIFSRIRSFYPDLRLVKVGGEWTQSQQQQIADLNIGNSIIHLQGLDRSTVASLYRQASAVLLTSEAEGFGLPVIEALACGAVMLASDIPVLHEVGGESVIYCKMADVSDWVSKLVQVLANPASVPEQHYRLSQAAKYSWSNHAQIIAQAYLQLSC
jgi:glycosyltransferase involved in cell wall biosynthesis